MRIASDNGVIRGRWEEPVGAVAGIQVPIGSGRAAFWGISPYFDRIEDTASVLAFLRYALTSLGLSVPPETTHDGPLGPLLPSFPRHPLPQFLLHPRGKRHVAETVLSGLGLSTAAADSSGDSELGVIKDVADTFHIHGVATLEHAARLVEEAKRASADASSHVAIAMDAPRVVVVLPPDDLPTGELTPSFDAEKYFKVLADVRGDRESDADNWGVGEALFYGEAVTSTQTMLDRYARLSPRHTTYTPLPSPVAHNKLPQNAETRASWHRSLRRSSPLRRSSSQGAAAAPIRGSRHQGACNSPSSYARLWARRRRRSPRRASSSCNTSSGWPSSAHAAMSARWAPRGARACGSSGPTTCTSTCPRRREAARRKRSAGSWSIRASRTGTCTSSSVRCVLCRACAGVFPSER